MKKIIRRIQSLNESASQLTAAAGQLPTRVAELREAMKATTGELQTLKTDIQVNIADLQIEHEEDIGTALVEVAGHAAVFQQAGFLLDALDVEVSPIQRMIVTLKRQKDVDIGKLQELIQQYRDISTMRSILSALFKARTMVDNIEIDGLDYDKLIIGIGPVPTIRLSWRDRSAKSITPVWQPTAAQPLTSSATTSFFGPALQSSFAPAKPPTEPEAEEIPTPQPTPVAVAKPPPLPTQPVDPLARFKVMPHLNRPQ
jgi:hypothetical protein